MHSIAQTGQAHLRARHSARARHLDWHRGAGSFPPALCLSLPLACKALRLSAVTICTLQACLGQSSEHFASQSDDQHHQQPLTEQTTRLQGRAGHRQLGEGPLHLHLQALPQQLAGQAAPQLELLGGRSQAQPWEQ